MRYNQPKATQKGAMPGNKHSDLSHLPYLLIPKPTSKSEGCAIHSVQLQWQGAGQAMWKGQAEDTPYTLETFSHVLDALPQSKDGLVFWMEKTKTKTSVLPLGPKILGFWQIQQCTTGVSQLDIFLKNFFASI